MHTKESIIKDIKKLGVFESDVLTVHTSLKAIGAVDTCEMTGAEVVISALRECVSKGLLVIPSHTFRNIREDAPLYDIRRTVPCIGVLPRVAVEMANQAADKGDKTCIRSMQPSHSVVAFGEGAVEFTEHDRASSTRTPMSGCYGELYRRGGKILLLGVGMINNTFIHAVDEEKYPTVYGSTKLTLIDYDGSMREQERLLTKGPSSFTFDRYTEEIERRGGLIRGKVGDADAILVDVRICYDVVKGVD